MRIPPRLPIAIAAGLLSATGFAPLDLWPLTLFGVAALLAMVHAAPTLRRALLLGWGFGLGHFTLGLNWIATACTYQAAMPAWLGWIAVVLLSIYLAVYPAAAAGLAWRWGRQNSHCFVLIAAAAWIVTEWLRANLFTGFAWNPLAVIWVPGIVANNAMFVGTYGLSGITILFAGALMLLADRQLRPPWLFGFFLTVLAVLGGLTGTLAQQDVRALESQPPLPPKLMLRVVQPNIGQAERDERGYAPRLAGRLATLTGPPTRHPRLILWPEAAVPDYLEEEPWARARLARLLGPNDVLLTGGVALEWGQDGHVIAARNSVFAVDPAGRLIERYDKAHLVPYGEYLPMRPLLSAIGLSRLVPGDLDFWPGPGPRTLTLPGVGDVGLQLCYEIIFSGQVIDARHRPALIFNPSNDAWFGAWGPPQHLAQARLRAIEEGVTVVRSTPNGISAVITPDGRIAARVPRHRAGAIDWPFPAPTPPTPFARLGNLLSFLVAGLLVVAAIALPRIRR